MKNHLGEKEYQTYAGWKHACKKAAGNNHLLIDGDKDIATAFSEPFIPCVLKNAIGEWDGSKGCIYNNTNNKLLTP